MSRFHLRESAVGPVRRQALDRGAKTYRQFVAMGCLSVQGSLPVLEAGCGVDLVGEAFNKTHKGRLEFPRVTHLYLSLKEHAAAQRRLVIPTEILYQYVSCNLKKTTSESPQADFGFCRFAFESPSQPGSFFEELTRSLKPTGVSDKTESQNGSLIHYSLDADRKLYSFFTHPAIGNVRVYFRAQYIFYGPLGGVEGLNSPAKILQPIEFQRDRIFHQSMGCLQDRFFEFLRFPGRFNYTPLILAEKRRLS